jgi:hypothetical protein
MSLSVVPEFIVIVDIVVLSAVNRMLASADNIDRQAKRLFPTVSHQRAPRPVICREATSYPQVLLVWLRGGALS